VAAGDQSKCNRSVTGNSHRYRRLRRQRRLDHQKDKRGLLLESPLDVHSLPASAPKTARRRGRPYERRIPVQRARAGGGEAQSDIDHARGRVASRCPAGTRTRPVTRRRPAPDRPHYIDERQAVVTMPHRPTRAQRDVDDAAARVRVRQDRQHQRARSVSTWMPRQNHPTGPGGRAALRTRLGRRGKETRATKRDVPAVPLHTLKDINS